MSQCRCSTGALCLEFKILPSYLGVSVFRRGLLILLTALAVAGCDNDSATAPGDPNVVVFVAQLGAANEVPAVSNAESNARGTARIRFDLSRDAANNVTGAMASIRVSLSSFPAGSTWTLAHIHRGEAGVAGGVVVNTGLSPASPIALANGSVSNQRFSNLAVTAAVANDIINNPEAFYFNVHTVLNPAGAVRGQLVRR